MIDTLDMLGAALSLPEQIEAARTSFPTGLSPLPERPTSIVVMGMGGSGIAGDVVAATLADAPIPIIVSKGYECPGFVGPTTLVIAVSFSGNTDETLHAVADAARRGASIVAVCAGGALAGLATEIGAPVLPVDGSIPMPRAAIGALSASILLLLERLGLVADVAAELDAAVEQLGTRREQFRADPAAVRAIARRVGRTLPIVYGAGAVGSVAAIRWKGQFNENPKVASFANRVPELTHNEICGWGQHGDVTRQVFTLVLLRHSYEHPRDSARLAIVTEMCEEVVADIVEVEAAGDTRLAQLMDLTLVGDLVTLQAAANEGVDPGPIPALDEIKARIATL